MKLRWQIIRVFTPALGILQAALGLAYYVELDRFLLRDTARRVRAQVKPTIDAYMGRVAAMGLSLPAIAADLARDLTSRDTSARVIDATGQAMALGKTLPVEPLPARPRASLVQRAVHGDNEASEVLRTKAGREIVLYVPLRAPVASSNIIGVVQLTTPLAAVDRSLRQIGWILFGTAGATLLAGGGLAVLFSRHLALPLEKLEATCRAIAAGEWGQRSDLPHGSDEVGRLAASFDEMIHRLETAFAAQHRFVADAAHQLKTPLTALSGYLELLDREVIAERDQVVASIPRMREQLRRFDHLVRKLVTLASLDAGLPMQRAPVDLEHLAQGIAQDFRPAAGGRTLRVVRTGDRPVQADPVQLGEALANLVDNAIRHTGSEGTITIEVGNGNLRIRDNGEGIPPDRIGRIFDRFYRYPPSGDGSGLGLAIVRSIVEAHGGTVSAESTPGEGTTITLSLA